jgi:hypothetical protein
MFDWATEKTAFKKKLLNKSMGTVGSNSPASRSIETQNATFLYVDMGNKVGNLTETETAKEVSIQLGSGTANAYTLPWATNKAARIQLGQAHDKFITTQMTACGLIVCGDLTQPIVVHANSQADILYEHEPQGMATAQVMAKYNKTYKYPMLDSLYTVLVSKLFALGFITDVRIRTYFPTEYFDDAPGGVSVFGVKDGSNWSIYACCIGLSGGTTKKIWPE